MLRNDGAEVIRICVLTRITRIKLIGVIGKEKEIPVALNLPIFNMIPQRFHILYRHVAGMRKTNTLQNASWGKISLWMTFKFAPVDGEDAIFTTEIPLCQ